MMFKKFLNIAPVIGMAASMCIAEDVSFTNDIVPILKTKCANCHLTGQEAGGMALTPKAAYANIVNVKSIESSLMRVKPGAPENSYLILKLEGKHLDAGGSGAQMPFGQPPLDQPTQQRIRDWIAKGAPQN